MGKSIWLLWTQTSGFPNPRQQAQKEVIQAVYGRLGNHLEGLCQVISLLSKQHVSLSKGQHSLVYICLNYFTH